MTAELLSDGVDDDEAVVISWLQGVLAPGKPISNERIAGDPLPAIIVEHTGGKECVEESYVDDVVSVHMLYPRGTVGDGVKRKAAIDGCAAIHRRMLQLCRYLEDVPLPGGRTATIDYCDVFSPPQWVAYGDEQILRKVAQYRLGLGYVKMS